MFDLPADAVHGDGKSLVSFLADGPERHGAGGEALDDFFGGLDFLERNWCVALFQLHQAAQSTEVGALFVDEVGVFLKCLGAFLPHRLLQLADGQGIQQVIFAVHPLVITATDRELSLELGERAEGVVVLQQRFGSENRESNAFEARSCTGKVGVNQFFVQPDGFENLGALIALQSGDAHLREGLQQSLLDGFHVVLHREFGSNAVAQLAAPDFPSTSQVLDTFKRQVWVNRAGPIAAEQREMHDFAGFARFGDQGNLGSRFFPHQ